MHGPYPRELRTRVIDFVEEGGSRREAAERFDLSVSSAIRWVQRFRENGTSEPMPSGGSTSPLEKYSRQILALISAQRDLTLDEIVSALHKRRIPGSRSALSRFFARHGITIKKVCRRQSGSAPTSPARADAGFGSKAFLIRPTLYLLTRRQSLPTCCGLTVGTHAASVWSAMPRWDTGIR
jgi:transposase